MPIDLGKTSPSFASKVGRAISLHGGLRLADTKSSLFSANFTQEGQSGVKLELLKGQPKVPFAEFSLDAGSVDLSLSRVLDAMVEKILKIPGFFSGKITYLSSLSGHKEVFVSDSLMSNARLQTSLVKLINPSWSNDGQGIFFRSNRKFSIMFTFCL